MYIMTKKWSQRSIQLRLQKIRTLDHEEREKLLSAFEDVKEGGGVSREEARRIILRLRNAREISENDAEALRDFFEL